MGASQKTKYYGLPLFAPDDATSWEEFNNSMVEIDRLLYLAESAGGGGGDIPPDLVDRVTALEAEALKLSEDIANLNIVSGANSSNISELQTKNTSLETKVDALEVQTDDNTGDISSLVTKTNTLETEQGALGDEITDLQDANVDITEKINNLTTKTNDLPIFKLDSMAPLADSVMIYSSNAVNSDSTSLPKWNSNGRLGLQTFGNEEDDIIYGAWTYNYTFPQELTIDCYKIIFGVNHSVKNRRACIAQIHYTITAGDASINYKRLFPAILSYRSPGTANIIIQTDFAKGNNPYSLSSIDIFF